MKLSAANLLLRLVRVLSLVLLAALGTIALMRFAPGYFTDSREMDAPYADGARAALKLQEEQQGSMLDLVKLSLGGWMHGDLGRSRQYDVPVTELLGERARSTGKLLASGIACGWLFAFCLALPLSTRRFGRTYAGEAVIAAPAAILLAIPTGALATACLLANFGGPMLVLSTLVGVRDFKFLYRMLRHLANAPHLLHARAQGIPPYRVALVHLLPRLTTELLTLASMSFVIALSAIVPVEVIFDVPGLGQLAWSAAMNRDLPVLLAVTLLVATCVGLAGLVAEPIQRAEGSACV